MRLVVVRREDTAADVVALARRDRALPVPGHRRRRSDDIVGLVHLRRAIAVPYERRAEVPAAALMVDAPRVPETVHLGPLLVELREHGPADGRRRRRVRRHLRRRHARGRRRGARRRRRRRARPRGAPARARPADGSWLRARRCCGPTSWPRSPACACPTTARTRRSAVCVMAELGRIPRVGDEVVVDGVLLRVEADGRPTRRAGAACAPVDAPTTEDGVMSTGLALALGVAPARRQRVLRRRGVRHHLRPPQRRSSRSPRPATGARKTVLWAMEHVSLMLACAQLGITVCSTSLGVVAEPAIAHLIEGPLDALGRQRGPRRTRSRSSSRSRSSCTCTSCSARWCPRTSPSPAPTGRCCWFGPPLVWVARVRAPGHHRAQLARQPRRCGCSGSSRRTRSPRRSPRRRCSRSSSGRRPRGCCDDEQGLLAGAIEFSDRTAADVMVPVERAGHRRRRAARPTTSSGSSPGPGSAGSRWSTPTGVPIGLPAPQGRAVRRRATRGTCRCRRGGCARSRWSRPQDEVEDALAAMQRSGVAPGAGRRGRARPSGSCSSRTSSRSSSARSATRCSAGQLS